MSDEKQVPGPASESGERVQRRDYDSDFARLPADETEPHADPGAGPGGTIDSAGLNLPVVVIGVGTLVAFSTFFLRSPWALGIGLVIVVAGAIWAGLRGDRAGLRGPGTTTLPDEEH